MLGSIKKFYFSIFIFILFLPFVNSTIGIMGSQVNKINYSVGEEIKISSYFVNREDLVKSNVSIKYELIREKDLSVFYDGVDSYSFDKYEAKLINKSIKIPLYLNSDNYVLQITTFSSSGAPVSFIQHNLKINSYNKKEVLYFKELPFLKIYYEFKDGRIFFENSYSNTGKPIVPNSTFEVKFSLDSSNYKNKDIVVEFEIENSYNIGELKKIYSKNFILKNDMENFTIPISLNESGTFKLFVNIYDENHNLLLSKDVRVVIIGDGGNILDVFNHKDVYFNGEDFNLDVVYVGPADALTTVKNVLLNVKILKENREVENFDYIIDQMPLNPEKINFKKKLNEDLDKYKVIVTLSKNGKIYDKVELNYEELNPKILISLDGRLYDPNVIACFDDSVCTDVEKSLGNCMDCIKPKFEKNKDFNNETINLDGEDVEINKNIFLIIFVLILILIALLFVFKKRRSKNGF
jgi:hypothetical protein